jgi:serine protease
MSIRSSFRRRAAFSVVPFAALLAPAIAHAETPASLASGEPFGDVSGDEINGAIAVDLKNDVTATDIAELGKAYGLTLRANSAFSDSEKLEIADVSPADERSILDRLARDPRVEHAEPMAVLRASFVPNDPLYADKQWHLKKAGAEQAWDYACGQGVTVAVVDTGVACYDKGPFSKGTDLAGTRCGDGFNFVDDTPEAVDDQGHGTHVAGTIAQTTNNGVGVAGMAHCARLMPVKVLNKMGWGTLADVAEGIRFAADNGAQVINLSLGGPGKSAILEDAVVHAQKKGVIVVAAAGNSGRSVGYPAAYDGVIAVSATDSNDNIAWFSSRGPQIAIGAPGVAVTQQTICEGGKNKCEVFGTFNGTSMASPHVAGAAAMVVGLGVTDPASVKSALMSSARPKDDPKLFGAGVLDAGAATSHVFWSHVLVRGLALLALFFAVASRIKKFGGKPSMSFGTIAGALIASVGLLPMLPLAGIASHAGSFRWLAELAMRPFGEWDIILGGVNLHRWLPLASAIPSMALTAFLFGSKRARPIVGGFAVGSAALLVQLAIQADVAFPLGGVALRVFAVANALLCLWIARISLDKKTA